VLLYSYYIISLPDKGQGYLYHFSIYFISFFIVLFHLFFSSFYFILCVSNLIIFWYKIEKEKEKKRRKPTTTGLSLLLRPLWPFFASLP